MPRKNTKRGSTGKTSKTSNTGSTGYTSNHPVIVWGTLVISIISIISIAWSLSAFFFIGDILILSSTDLINALLLLSGIIMLPSNAHLLHCIAHDTQINLEDHVVFCPLWLYIIFIIIFNVLGLILCLLKIFACNVYLINSLNKGMIEYRTSPLHKRFMDNLQWTLKCCGLNSYEDWFTKNWYDKIRDYKWEPSSKKRLVYNAHPTTDSVPLSCCKTGSCIPNYLSELGTYSIETKGCHRLFYRVIMTYLFLHLFIFLIVIINQLLILRFLKPETKTEEKKAATSSKRKRRTHQVRQMLETNCNVDHSSESFVEKLGECEELEEYEYEESSASF